MTTQLEQAWDLAKQRFAAVGVDVEEALRQLDRLPVSMHCWQGDDVAGFENPGGSLTGGIQATGNYPGKARNATELRADLELALSLIPGPKRLNLHAIYLESDEPVARNEIKPEHFKNWVEWAKANRLGLDFNPSCFSHPLSADGFTLAHADDDIRQFWIEHVKASRRVSAYFGEQLGTPSVMNIWIPDGMKDITVDRLAPRQRLLAALDEAISEKLDPAHHIDAVESKLFGIGAESYTVGSNEFYMGYATSRQTALCLDAGHFHPTEVISDKISAAMLYVPRLLLHVSRPVRWDSDHVVLLDDETQAIASEIVRHNLFDHVNIKSVNTFIPNGMEADVEKECSRYNAIIRSMGGIDLQLLGIGNNGHIGFNEPSDSFAKETHCVDLTENTIQANARFFSFIEEVPTQAYTTGIKNIMQARHILLIASGEAKADALYEAVYGPITPHVPASILQLHDEVSVVADEAALSRIIKEGLI